MFLYVGQSERCRPLPGSEPFEPTEPSHGNPALTRGIASPASPDKSSRPRPDPEASPTPRPRYAHIKIRAKSPGIGSAP